MSKSNVVKLGLLFAAVFGFAAGLASVQAGIEGFDPCCTIPATPMCTEGIGMVYKDGTCHYCFPCEGNPCDTCGRFGCCTIQVAPQCD